MREPNVIQPGCLVICINAVGSKGRLAFYDIYQVMDISWDGHSIYLKDVYGPLSTSRFKFYQNSYEQDWFQIASDPRDEAYDYANC